MAMARISARLSIDCEMNSQINDALLRIYCERTMPGVWQEPLNALSNLAFILAGILAWRLYSKRGLFSIRRHWDFLLLIALLFAIGIGSALWHFVPTRHTILADVIPILIFINIYLLSFLYRIAKCNWQWIVILYLLFLILNVAINLLFNPNLLNGSIFYAAGWITLIVMGVYLWAIKHPMRKQMLAAGGIFTLSLLFRTIDNDVCQWVPEGTHFIWHLLNAYLLYLLIGILFEQQADAEVKNSTPMS
jgi:hypothetical protein